MAIRINLNKRTTEQEPKKEPKEVAVPRKKGFFTGQLERSPTARVVKRVATASKARLSGWWARQKRGEKSWGEWFEDQTSPTAERFRYVKQKAFTTQLGKLEQMRKEIASAPVTEEGFTQALANFKAIESTLKAHHKKHDLSKLPNDASELTARQAKAELSYQLMQEVHAQASNDIKKMMPKMIENGHSVEQVNKNILAARLDEVNPPELNVRHDSSELAFPARAKRTGKWLFAKTLGNTVNSGKVAWNFGRTDLVKDADKQVPAAGTGSSSLTPSHAQLEEKTGYILEKTTEALGRVSGVTGLAARQAIMHHAKKELLRLHLRSAPEQEYPDSSVFPVEDALMRSARYVVNAVKIARRRFKEVEPGLAFSSQFWDKYAGAIVKTKAGNFIKIPDEPKPGQKPVFLDAVTNRNAFPGFSSEAFMYASLHPSGNGIHKIERVYKNVDHEEIIRRVERLRRG